MKGITKYATAATLAVITCVAGYAQDRERDVDVAKADDELAERRQEILQMAETTIMNLEEQDEAADELLEQAYGYAVFDTTKAGLVVTGAGGTGVAQRKTGRDAVFMHMGAGGIGLGAGVENYKLVVIFADQETYRQFVDGNWKAGVSAQASAGGDGVAAVGRFVNGVAVYHLTDEGVIAQVDVTGVRFWPSDRLNPGIA